MVKQCQTDLNRFDLTLKQLPPTPCAHCLFWFCWPVLPSDWEPVHIQSRRQVHPAGGLIYFEPRHFQFIHGDTSWALQALHTSMRLPRSERFNMISRAIVVRWLNSFVARARYSIVHTGFSHISFVFVSPLTR